MLFAENFYTLLAFFFIFLLSRGHKRSSMAMLYLLLFPGFYRHNSYTPNQPCLYLKNLLNATIFLLCLPFNHGDAISILCYKKHIISSHIFVVMHFQRDFSQNFSFICCFFNVKWILIFFEIFSEAYLQCRGFIKQQLI